MNVINDSIYHKLFKSSLNDKLTLLEESGTLMRNQNAYISSLNGYNIFWRDRRFNIVSDEDENGIDFNDGYVVARVYDKKDLISIIVELIEEQIKAYSDEADESDDIQMVHDTIIGMWEDSKYICI